MVTRATARETESSASVSQAFPKVLAALVESISTHQAALYALLAYTLGLNGLVLRSEPRYPFPELNRILGTLYEAVGDVVSHGDDGGARHARRFFQDVLAAAERYAKQRKPTRREIVLGAIRTPVHALMPNKQSKYTPNYQGIAEAVLWSGLSRDDFLRRKLEKAEEFVQPVTKLGERLSSELSRYYEEGHLRSGIDPDEVARHAFRVAGISPHNSLDAAERMRASRARRRT